MTREALMLELVRAGLVQFGYFTPSYGEKAAPIRFQFTLLPSFPGLMGVTARHFRDVIGEVAPDTRLLCTSNMIGLASTIAVQSNIPLLFPMQVDGKLKIEGTADVDNPIVLITDVVRNDTSEAALLKETARIGLPVTRIVSLLDMWPNKDSIQHDWVYNFRDIVNLLHDNEVITTLLRDNLLGWHNNA